LPSTFARWAGDLGVPEQLFAARAHADGDPDAGRDGKLGAADRERRPQRFEQPLGDQLGARVERGLIRDHHEVVPAETSQRVAVADEPVEARRDAAQQFVADAVAERVVDDG